jgi:hypothetical protein
MSPPGIEVVGDREPLAFRRASVTDAFLSKDQRSNRIEGVRSRAPRVHRQAIAGSVIVPITSPNAPESILVRPNASGTEAAPIPIDWSVLFDPYGRRVPILASRYRTPWLNTIYSKVRSPHCIVPGSLLTKRAAGLSLPTNQTRRGGRIKGQGSGQGCILLTPLG